MKVEQKDIIKTVLFFGNNLSTNPRHNYFMALRIRCVIKLIIPEPKEDKFYLVFNHRRHAKKHHMDALLKLIKELERWQDIMDVRGGKNIAQRQHWLLRQIRIVAIKITGDFRELYVKKALRLVKAVV